MKFGDVSIDASEASEVKRSRAAAWGATVLAEFSRGVVKKWRWMNGSGRGKKTWKQPGWALHLDLNMVSKRIAIQTGKVRKKDGGNYSIFRQLVNLQGTTHWPVHLNMNMEACESLRKYTWVSGKKRELIKRSKKDSSLHFVVKRNLT